MAARRYLLNAVEAAINARPMWTTSRDLKDDVNRRIKKNGWNKRITAAHVGALAKILCEEGRITRRPAVVLKPRRWEYKPVFRLGIHKL